MRKPLFLLIVLFVVVAFTYRITKNRTFSLPKSGNVPTSTTEPNTHPDQSVSSGNIGNPFGVMIPSGKMSIPLRVSTAKNLNATYYRPISLFVDQWTANASCDECDQALAGGLKLILTVRNNGGSQKPTSPPSDLNAYKEGIRSILTKYKPAVLVIENEENSALFYTGTPAQYFVEMKAACDVAHQLGVKCTNGGPVSSLMALLVGDSYIRAGQPAKGEEYLKRTLPADKYSTYLRAIKNEKGQKTLDAQVEKGRELFEGYKHAGADYVNFHWYIADTSALAEAVSFAQKISGLPAMINEMGQQQNENPEQVQQVMKKAIELKIPYVIWFSLDVNGYGGARALQEDSGTLRPNGEMFKQIIEDEYR